MLRCNKLEKKETRVLCLYSNKADFGNLQVLDGLVAMISACQLNNCKRGRPGFDSQSGSFFLLYFALYNSWATMKFVIFYSFYFKTTVFLVSEYCEQMMNRFLPQEGATFKLGVGMRVWPSYDSPR